MNKNNLIKVIQQIHTQFFHTKTKCEQQNVTVANQFTVTCNKQTETTNPFAPSCRASQQPCNLQKLLATFNSQTINNSSSPSAKENTFG